MAGDEALTAQTEMARRLAIPRRRFEVMIQTKQVPSEFLVKTSSGIKIRHPDRLEALLRHKAELPVKMGRPPAPQAAVYDDVEIEWRRRAISECLQAVIVVEKLMDATTSEVVLKQLDILSGHLDALDGMLSDGARGPEL